jgi:hypothetical protein
MDFIKGIFNVLADPRLYFLLMVGSLVFMVWKRDVFISKAVGYGLLLLLTLFFLLGGLDPNFQLIITKPDNVPIVGLIFLLVFFTWYSMREAVLNDQRIAKGDGPVEKAESDRVWVWPDLVYTELIALILCSVLLIVWSIVLKAPLEQPANRAVTPNPSKAPWYFLGLQEMSLIRGSPVVLPSLIIVGLIAIPTSTRTRKGTVITRRRAERKSRCSCSASSSVVVADRAGTFLRGPNWNFFGPFGYWDTHSSRR